MERRLDKPPRLPRPRSIVESYEGLPDPRLDRTRAHGLSDILVVGLCSMLAGCDSLTDMEFFGRRHLAWFKTFLKLPNGIPSHDTFNRVFSAIDPHRFMECLVDWVQGVCSTLDGDIVAIDGKALRRAVEAGKPIPYIVSAWATEHGLALGQVQVDEKSNEITAVPKLLRILALQGGIVTLDAMGCQKEIAAQIVDKGADYVLSLKGNQGIARKEFTQYFDFVLSPTAPGARPERKAKERTLSSYRTVETGHGRTETRHYWQSTDIAWFQNRKLWKGLQSIGMVKSTRTINSKRSTERRYYISSLPLDARQFARAVRGHWGVENPLHWSLDVTFREDQCRARSGHAAQNLATLRRLALNMLKNDKTEKLSIRQKRMLAAMDLDYLKCLIGV
jgi:predicted transposase YbfD/YdcC